MLSDISSFPWLSSRATCFGELLPVGRNSLILYKAALQMDQDCDLPWQRGIWTICLPTCTKFCVVWHKPTANRKHELREFSRYKQLLLSVINFINEILKPLHYMWWAAFWSGNTSFYSSILQDKWKIGNNTKPPSSKTYRMIVLLYIKKCK